jgi:acetyltransferase-like isoleucine patch superfamily enzyme
VNRNYFAHSHALVEPGAIIGAGTRIWAFTHVLGRARVGADCNICDHVFIENDVSLGDRVTIKCGVQLWDGLRIADDVFIGPCAVFTNDLTPRSKQYPKAFLKTVLSKGASIGANATVLPGLTIGEWAMVGAAAVVTRDVPAYALVVGNPARFVSWICPCGLKLKTNQQPVIRCGCGKQYRLTGGRQLREASNGALQKRRGLSH